MKTNVYVDAFNLYYGSLKNSPYKWLNIKKLCELAFPQDQINRIRIFAARVSAIPSDLQKPNRQDIYFRALRTLPNLEIHLGQFKRTEVWMPLVNPFPTNSVDLWPEGTPRPGSKSDPVVRVKTDGTQMGLVEKMEEKGSDVNLGAYLLIDAYVGDYDQAVVISNNSDLKVPIDFINRTLHKPVCLLHPCRTSSSGPHPRGPGKELKRVAHNSVEITDAMLAASQFDDTLIDRHGIITKPSAW